VGKDCSRRIDISRGKCLICVNGIRMLIFDPSTDVLYWKICYCKHSLSDKCLTHRYVDLSVRCTSCGVTGIMYAK
jgi:hypothetical protein